MKELFSALTYGSYAANRDNGMTHEQLLSIGIGNDAMKEKYDNEGTPKEPVIINIEDIHSL